MASIHHADTYATVLRGPGAEEVRVRTLGWRYWYGRTVARHPAGHARKGNGAHPYRPADYLRDLHRLR